MDGRNSARRKTHPPTSSLSPMLFWRVPIPRAISRIAWPDELKSLKLKILETAMPRLSHARFSTRIVRAEGTHRRDAGGARRSSLSATSLSLKGPRCRLLPSTSVVGNRHVPVAALQTRCKPGLPVWSKSGQAEVRDLPTDNVRFGSLADISERIRDVRFTPDSGHAERKHRRPLCAISGSWGQNVHQAAQLAGLHSGRASSISIRDIE